MRKSCFIAAIVLVRVVVFPAPGDDIRFKRKLNGFWTQCIRINFLRKKNKTNTT